MADVLKKALQLLTGNDPDALANFKVSKKKRPLKTLTERELIQLESEIGAQLFGPVPKGHRREFFNLDPVTWIWYEESLDANGKTKTSTTRYEVQDKGILKVQEGARYTFLDGQELKNLTLAVQLYYERVMREVYHRDPQSGQKLA
jgi:hypothetical protein